MALRNVIMGPMGSGKTSLFNKLGLKNLETADANESVTRNIFACKVNCGDYNQYITDTPGADSKKNAYQHAVQLKTALTYEKLNAIFVMVVYQSRSDPMLESYEKTIQPLVAKDYEKHVIIIISKFDQCAEEYRARRKEELKKFFEDESDNPNTHKMIFSDYNMDGREIANDLYAASHDMEPVQLEYTEQDFVINFPVLELDKNMKKFVKDTERKIKEIVAAWWRFITMELNSNMEDYTEILLSVLAPIREDLESINTKCQDTYADKMVELNHYTQYIALQQRIREEIYKFEDLVYGIVNPLQPPEARVLRKCPHCGIIWLKVEGCDGETTCGNRPSNKQDVRGRPWYKFTFKFVNNAIKWTKNTETQPQAQSKSTQPQTNNIRQQGCGRQIIWKKMPTLQQHELKDLYESVAGIEAIVEGTKETWARAQKPKVDTQVHFV